MRQITLAWQDSFERYAKKTRREKFLEEMDGVMPWSELEGVDRAPLPEGGQRPSADGVAHDAAHLLSLALVQPVGPGSRRGAVRFAGAAAVCGRRSGPCPGAGRDDHFELPPSARSARSVRQHAGCGEPLFAEPRHPHRRRHDRRCQHYPCALVDQERDGSAQPLDAPMHQTKKGNKWYFGMKAHIGVDAKEGHVHSLCSTAASVADKHMLPTFCTVRNARCGATEPIRDRARRLAKPRPKPRT
jgi:transposase, IS5 family